MKMNTSRVLEINFGEKTRKCENFFYNFFYFYMMNFFSIEFYLVSAITWFGKWIEFLVMQSKEGKLTQLT